MKQRTCNVLDCPGLMRRTRQTMEAYGVPLWRVFVCEVCGNKQPWIDQPTMNGAAAELHHTNIEGGHFSGFSISSDKCFTAPLRRMRDGSLKRISFESSQTLRAANLPWFKLNIEKEEY